MVLCHWLCSRPGPLRCRCIEQPSHDNQGGVTKAAFRRCTPSCLALHPLCARSTHRGCARGLQRPLACLAGRDSVRWRHGAVGLGCMHEWSKSTERRGAECGPGWRMPFIPLRHDSMSNRVQHPYSPCPSRQGFMPCRHKTGPQPAILWFGPSGPKARQPLRALGPEGIPTPYRLPRLALPPTQGPPHAHLTGTSAQGRALS